MKDKKEWSYDEIRIEFSNLNYYLTVIDTCHLIEGQYKDEEAYKEFETQKAQDDMFHFISTVCQTTPIDKRHKLFQKLTCQEPTYNTLTNKRTYLTSYFIETYQNLTTNLAKIQLDKWLFSKSSSPPNPLQPPITNP